MLLSMTGFGESLCQRDGLTVSVEMRTINSRYLKVSMRTGDGYSSLEPQIESLVRKKIRRGTIQVSVRVDRAKAPEDFGINGEVLGRYRQQLEAIQKGWNVDRPINAESLLLLPGVVSDDSTTTVRAADDWPIIKKAVTAALGNLHEMRAEEGRSMAVDLAANCDCVAVDLEEIERRAPLVVDAYRRRLHDRLTKILDEYSVKLDPSDLLKEVSLFADRSDISEEIVRLRSHLAQFDTIMELPESSGRKLEFLTQEMVRESNTIGSKANDVEIARHVIEIKAAVERIREQIQNVE